VRRGGRSKRACGGRAWHREHEAYHEVAFVSLEGRVVLARAARRLQGQGQLETEPLTWSRVSCRSLDRRASVSRGTRGEGAFTSIVPFSFGRSDHGEG
jgi:hypothetical protein